MENIPEEDIINKLYKEFREFNPDFLIPIGNRVFNLLLLSQNDFKEVKEMLSNCINVNALNYIDYSNKSIMVLDGETEFGREFDVYETAVVY
ncbi:MAG: hypothetical protein M1591_09320 [Deltaproteobacteria bacterium]|nr:hypothetical protein [Deltaproteobacteria bacterium]